MKTTLSTKPRVTQCQKPVGWLGRLVLRNMNARHSGVTDWGLSQISVKKHFAILDIGCGGGRTVSKLAAVATEGKVYGVDYSTDSVAVASKTNRESIKSGCVEIREGSCLSYRLQRVLSISLSRSRLTSGGRICQGT